MMKLTTDNATAPVFPIHFDCRACGDLPPGDPPPGDPPPPADPPPSGLLNSPDAFQIPEKFMVKGADDQPDFKAIVEKLGQSYTHLEKRFGTGDLPPKTADEYKIENFLPEGYEPNQDVIKPILGEFHKLGLTNAQAQGVLSIYGKQAETGLAQEKASYESAMANLKQSWGDQYDLNLTAAKTGLAAYTAQDKDLAAAMTKYVNDPVIIRLLAAVGADLREDRPANGMDAGAAESIDELRTSKAYLDPKDPGHADAVRKVNDAYQKGYKVQRA